MKPIEILLTFADISIETFAIFDYYRIYSRGINNYREWRKKNKVSTKEMYYLKSKKYLEENEGNYTLTRSGQNKIMRHLLDNITVTSNKKWDGKYYLVIFDIPETHKAARQAFRRKIQEFGFQMIQKSIFCFPYDCYKELTYIAKAYDISKYVSFIVAEKIVSDKDFEKIFLEKGII